MKNQGRTLLQKDGTKTVLASLLSIVIGLAVGSILVLVVGLFSDNLGMASAWEGIRLIFFGILSTGRNTSGSLTWGFNPQSIGNMLFRATPLILTGLSVSVAFKTGLFNIGAPGQYLMGTMVTLAIALGIPVSALPSPVIWLLAFLGGMLAGALWGCIPGLVKALLNINEVLACIMTNWIAANLVTWFFDANKMFQNTVENTKSSYVYKTAYGRTMVDGAWTYVDGSGVPELAAVRNGYYVSLYTWDAGNTYTLMDHWGYGAMGNAGYEYCPGKNSLRNYNTDYAGAILYTTYMKVGSQHTIDTVAEIVTYNFDNINGNGKPDEEEEGSMGFYSTSYINGTEATGEECAALNAGEYEFIQGVMSGEELRAKLKEIQ